MDSVIAVSDTVTVDGLRGHWVVDAIHPGAAGGSAYVTVSQTRREGSRARAVLTSRHERIDDLARLRLVRSGNAYRDKTGLGPAGSEFVIHNGRMRPATESRDDGSRRAGLGRWSTSRVGQSLDVDPVVTGLGRNDIGALLHS